MFRSDGSRGVDHGCQIEDSSACHWVSGSLHGHVGEGGGGGGKEEAVEVDVGSSRLRIYDVTMFLEHRLTHQHLP